MKTAIAISDDYVWSVWEWCSDAYLRHGRRLKFPADTDPKRTYQWRYVRSIASKFREWDFDEATGRRFIEIAVGRAVAIGVGHKGLAVLHQKNMLEVAYASLQQETAGNSTTIESLAIVHRFLAKQGEPLLDRLLTKRDRDSLPNIVMWLQSGRLTALYLSLSRTCNVAMKRLDQDDRQLLPKATALYSIRSSFVRDASNERQARRILASDWRELCPLRPAR